MKILVTTVLLFLTLPVSADEAELLDLLKQKQASTELRQAAIEAGDQRALLCKYCHGNDGNSKKSTIPNLAAQNTVYLIRQFEQFANGQRQNKTMNELAKILTPEEKVNIALFYAAQTVKPQNVYRPELLDQGKRFYETRCFFCHGKDGHGRNDLPRISSQPADYIVRTLSSYQSAMVKRAETQMSAIARTLKNDEIEALAAYLSSMP